MSDKPDKKPKKVKDAKKGKKGAAAGAPAADEHIRLSTHPAAAISVKRMRARCGLAAFIIVGALSLHAGVPAFDATFRALLAGIVGHLAAWYISITVWRQVVRQQALHAVEAYNARRLREHQEAAERAAAQMSAQEMARAEAEASWAANVGS
jgi:uncharacterized membrane protein